MKAYFLFWSISLLSSLVLGIFVWKYSAAQRPAKMWSFFCFFVVLISVGFLGSNATDDANTALFFIKLINFATAFLPAIFLDFVVSFTDSLVKLRKKLFSCYGFSVLFALTLIGDFLIKGVAPKQSFKFWLVPGPIYLPFMIYFALVIIYGHYLVFSAFSKASGVKKSQFRTFFIATAFGVSGGFTTFIPAFFPNVYPFGIFFVPLYCFIVAFAIVRYRFLDIQIIIKRTVVFAGLFSAAFAVFAFVTFVTQELLGGYVGFPRGASLAISVLLIVLIYDPLRQLLVNLTDRFLFQKRYDYRKLLRDASAGISHIESLQHLLSLVTHFITMKIRVKNASILMRENKTNRFKFGYARGYKWEEQIRDGFVFDENDPLIDYMKRERAALDYERVKELIESGGPKAVKGEVQKRYDYVGIQKRMEGLHANCCVPSFLGNELRNILILGEKKSGDFYTEDDINVLFTIAQESAIAIENARLYDQAVERANELKEINSRLEGAQTDLIRALNETEMANKKLRDTHVQLIHEQKMATLGRLAASVGHEVNNPLTILSMNVSRAILKYRRNPDLKVSEILEVFQKMEQNISRIKAVVNTLTGLLKKSERGKFEPLSLKLILEETLPLVRFQTYLENLSGTEVEFDIPGNTPLIKGDLERLQEVFLNLFINAYHAMVGKRLRKITVTARESSLAPEMVQIEFTDNGCGMPDEVMKKIFSYGFTTKPAGKGSGMGLYMCRYIIELHGGEIKVRSKIGEGTTFVITLPIYREPPTQIQAEGATGL